jgi:hypothetical protein
MHVARFAAAALALAALAAPPAGAVVVDAATIRVISGQAFDGFILTGGDTHAFLIEDFGLQSFSVSLKAAKGSTLLPDITFSDPGDIDVTSSLDPFRNDGARSVSIKNAGFPSGEGRYVLRVLGKSSSTGEYLLKVTAKVVKSFKGTGLVATGGGTDTISFFAPTEALVSVKAVHATGSTLAPMVGAAVGSPCAPATVIPGLIPGTATFRSPLSSVYDVDIVGDGGTAGAFNWVAKVKRAKASKKPVRVNGGAAFLADPGPAPATRLVGAGQSASGFATDGVDFCWREVRTQGGGGNLGRNSVTCTTIAGTKPRSLDNNLATDQTPPDHSFALGPDYAAAVAAGELFAIPRVPGSKSSLGTGVGSAQRVLADGTSAYVLQPDGIRSYDYPSGPAAPVSVVGGDIYLDMVLGGKGIVYGVQSGTDQLIRTMAVDGTDVTDLATLDPAGQLLALTARGPDAYFAVTDGTGFQLFRASACDPGTAIPMANVADGPATAMAADDLNVYILVDAADGIRVMQSSRGGGEAMAIARGDTPGGYTIDGRDLAAARGYVFFLADDGAATFYRVKRR